MKPLIFFTISVSVCLSALSAMAAAMPASYKVMLVKKASGFTTADKTYTVECEISNDQNSVVFTKAGSPLMRRTVPTVYSARIRSAEEAQVLIAEAALAKLFEVSSPPDLPSVAYTGILEGEVVDQYVKIYFGGEGTFQKNSATSGTEGLIEFGDANCPVP